MSNKDLFTGPKDLFDLEKLIMPREPVSLRSGGSIPPFIKPLPFWNNCSPGSRVTSDSYCDWEWNLNRRLRSLILLSAASLHQSREEEASLSRLYASWWNNSTGLNQLFGCINHAIVPGAGSFLLSLQPPLPWPIFQGLPCTFHSRLYFALTYTSSCVPWARAIKKS